jgi:hypothetical protein
MHTNTPTTLQSSELFPKDIDVTSAQYMSLQVGLKASRNKIVCSMHCTDQFGRRCCKWRVNIHAEVFIVISSNILSMFSDKFKKFVLLYVKLHIN